MRSYLTLILSIICALRQPKTTRAEDTYVVSPEHKSILFAMGCFWCAEETFEHYAPGVVEAVSGYAGGSNANPTYFNHPGHYEVVLVEYDPTKTSYQVLVQYAWMNIDPFDAHGQFCDHGSSYRPAIFYETEEERVLAELVFQESILPKLTDSELRWKDFNISVPLLERPIFWKAEQYHQDYYIKNPGNYGYYKNACGRTKRLKEIWGEDCYNCYHNLNSACNEVVLNSYGDSVKAVINVKDIGEVKAALLPKKGIIFVSVGCGLFAVLGIFVIRRRMNLTKNIE